MSDTMADAATRTTHISRGGRIATVAALAVLSLAMSCVLAFLLFTQKHYIASTSMAPSLNVDEFAMFLPTTLAGAPESGDIVTFHYKDAIWTKRLVAGPGDRVAMANGILSINGKPVERREAPLPTDLPPLDAAARVYEETLANGRSYLTIDGPAQGPMDDMAEMTVPQGHYFLIGDNRDNSYDSRFARIGTIPGDAITGRSPLIYFAYDASGLRFGRFGTWVR